MQFDPLGGFPPIIREDDQKISEKTLETRGFSAINIVNIGSIMDTQKKKKLYVAFGNEEEEGGAFLSDPAFDPIMDIYREIPHNFNSSDGTIFK
uniref:Uncharacterized protein n=1 Tax=viral metagenome TaxID=1070528 RepID=A0A6C0LQP0_9ZZZZ